MVFLIDLIAFIADNGKAYFSSKLAKYRFSESAKKMLENNPATFAPIQIDKIPSRFFGLIKAKPEDGKKINKKLGKFLKNLEA